MKKFILALVTLSMVSHAAFGRSKADAIHAAQSALEVTAKEFGRNLHLSLSFGRPNATSSDWPIPYVSGNTILSGIRSNFLVYIDGTTIIHKPYHCWGTACEPKDLSDARFAFFKLDDRFDNLGNKVGCTVSFYLNDWAASDQVCSKNYRTGVDLGCFIISQRVGALPKSFYVEGCN